MIGGIISRIFLVAIIAGGLAGLFNTAIQQIAVGPVILEAETYETAGADRHAHSHGEATGAHAHGDEPAAEGEAWRPGDGLERLAYSALANVLVAIGFGLLLTAGFALKGGVDWRKGILWGLGGFVAFNLSPGLGLPPELPGAVAAELFDRQMWWISAAVCGVVGLALMAFAAQPLMKALGLPILVLPHIIGAPQPDSHVGLASAALEEAFIYAAFATNAVFWIALGGLAGLLFDRMLGSSRGSGVVAA
jgi:cobalt transporter subunit CbtA